MYFRFVKLFLLLLQFKLNLLTNNKIYKTFLIHNMIGFFTNLFQNDKY